MYSVMNALLVSGGNPPIGGLVTSSSHPVEQAHPFSKYLPDVDPATFPQVHPHASIFPMISMEEMQAMTEDIKTNGLKHPITVVHLIDIKFGRDVEWILDG
jgi:hypothetical protein